MDCILWYLVYGITDFAFTTHFTVVYQFSPKYEGWILYGVFMSIYGSVYLATHYVIPNVFPSLLWIATEINNSPWNNIMFGIYCIVPSYVEALQGLQKLELRYKAPDHIELPPLPEKKEETDKKDDKKAKKDKKDDETPKKTPEEIQKVPFRSLSPLFPLLGLSHRVLYRHFTYFLHFFDILCL
jgi:hypothetical protein